MFTLSMGFSGQGMLKCGSYELRTRRGVKLVILPAEVAELHVIAARVVAFVTSAYSVFRKTTVNISTHTLASCGSHEVIVSASDTGVLDSGPDTVGGVAEHWVGLTARQVH